MQYAQMQTTEITKQSGLGIASFVLGIIGIIAIIAMVVVAGALQASTPGGLDEKSPAAIIIGMLIILAGLLCLIGLILGIAGLVQKDRKKVFAVLGMIFSSLAVFGTVALFILGISMR